MINKIKCLMLYSIFLFPMFSFCEENDDFSPNMMESNSNYYVYLAGKVRKGDEIKRIEDWRSFYISGLDRKDVHLMTPENLFENYDHPETVFGRDCEIIRVSDVVLVDGSRKLGIGTAQEILIAKHFKKPVIIVLPPNSAHRKNSLFMGDQETEDWINPFISVTTDYIVDSHEEGVNILNNIEKIMTKKPKDLSIIDNSIKLFIEHHKENVQENSIINKE